jgi:hypothetical protein
MLGNTLGRRYRIRLFDCDVPDRDEFGVWCIAGVHADRYRVPLRHAVESWEAPPDFLRIAFSGQPFVDEIRTRDLGMAGHWHGPPFDGLVTFIGLV